MDCVSYDKLIEISKELLKLEKEHNVKTDIQLDEIMTYEDNIKRETKLYVNVYEQDQKKYEAYMKSIEPYKPHIVLNDTNKKRIFYSRLTSIDSLKNIMTDESESFVPQNKIYVIHFWALWCGNGVDMLKEINELSKESSSLFQDKVDFIGISLDRKY